MSPAEALARHLGGGSSFMAELALDGLAADGFVVVDVNVAGADDLDGALRDFLLCTRPPSGAFGQSMEATMAYEAIRRLRAAAVRHLAAKGVAP
jgi:hypothetical protein